jgi:hypothetical protein
MDKKRRSAFCLLNGLRDREVVRIGARGTNAELAALVMRLEYRASLRAVDQGTAPEDSETPLDATAR